ncbi:MAG: hypothetical protein H0Z34_02825 [Brevibacillus sp.]|nr:hypothetical protein [Brevibacillus sp.]
MWKWIMVLILSLTGVAASPAAAAESIEISVDIPFNGIVQFIQWTRLEVTLTNNGEPFAGQLVLIEDRSRSGGSDRQVGTRQDVALGAGESKQYHIDLSGDMLQFQMRVDVVKGERIIASYPLPVINAKDEQAAAVVADDPNAFHFLTTNGQPSRGHVSLKVRNVKPEALPTESWIYKNVGLLALAGSAPGKLSDEQVAAIKEWVERGGVLLLSAGPGQDEAVRPFADILSIPAGSGGETSRLDFLQEIPESSQLPVSSLPVYHQDSPLFIGREWGAGLILFANYDVTAEPLASWQHNRALWQHLLNRYGAYERIERNMRSLFDYSGTSLSQMIPGVSTPAAEWMFVFWAAYVILVAPCLYLILKRLDRREWAWGLIPALAILLSIGVFTVGRAQVARENASYAVSSIEIVHDKLAEVRTTTSFLDISGGSNTIVADPRFVVSPTQRYGGYDKDTQAHVVQETGQPTRITLENVPYLTVKQISAAGMKRDVGSFASNLSVEGEHLRGTIRNDTAFDIDELYVDLGMQRVALGPLKQGEEKMVDEKIEPYAMPQPTGQRASRETLTREERNKELEREVLAGGGTGVRLIGTSTQPLPILSMEEAHQPYYYSVLRQEIKLVPNNTGLVVYPYGTLPVQLKEEKGEFFTTGPNVYELVEGSMTFALAAGQAEVEIKRLTVPLDLSPYRPFEKEVFHAKSNTWKPLERTQRVVLEEEVDEYLNDEGNLLIRFRNPSAQRLSLPTPMFQVEGEEEKR